MATTQAVHNRRENRKALHQSKTAKAAARRAYEQGVAVRMTQRFFPNKAIRLIWLDYRYWQARRCGWDATDPSYAMGYDPQSSPMWLWWTCLPWWSRMELVKLSGVRLKRLPTA